MRKGVCVCVCVCVCVASCDESSKRNKYRKYITYLYWPSKRTMGLASKSDGLSGEEWKWPYLEESSNGIIFYGTFVFLILLTKWYLCQRKKKNDISHKAGGIRTPIDQILKALSELFLMRASLANGLRKKWCAFWRKVLGGKGWEANFVQCFFC